MGHTLKFNPAAVKALGGNTRVRLLTKTRGGEVFFALRPSYRVSGKNVQLRVEPVEGEKHQIADLPLAVMAQVDGLPELKNNTHYHMEDIGYQWFILKASDTDIDDKKPGIFVSRLREKPAKKADDAATGTAADATSGTSDTASTATDKATEAHEPTGTTLEATDVVLTTTAESTGGDTTASDAGEGNGLADTASGDAPAEAAATDAPAEQAAASAKPKRVRPSRAKAKVDAAKAE